jgi:DNA-directed RNA polymerase subunit RPC12/RpoP
MQAESLPATRGPVFLNTLISDCGTNVDIDQATLLAGCERAPLRFNDARYCKPFVEALFGGIVACVRCSRRIAIVQRLQFLRLWQDAEVDIVPVELHGFLSNDNSPFSSARHR